MRLSMTRSSVSNSFSLHASEAALFMPMMINSTVFRSSEDDASVGGGGGGGGGACIPASLGKTPTKVALNAWSSDAPVVAAGAGTTCVAVRAGSLRLRFGAGAADTVGGASAPGASSSAGGEPSSCPYDFEKITIL